MKTTAAALLFTATNTCTSSNYSVQRFAPFIINNNKNNLRHRHRSGMALFSTSSNHYERMPNRVALLQFQVDHEKEVNLKTASDFIDDAAAQGASLLVLPEIWNGPYATEAFPEYAEKLPNVGEDINDDSMLSSICPSYDLIRRKAIEHNVHIVGGSISERVSSAENSSDSIFNTCMCVNPSGKLVAKHRKVHLFDIDVPGGIRFKESDTLTGGSTVSLFDAGEPFGKVGVGICYDIRFPELAMCMIGRGCRILVYPGAFNMTTGPAHWELLQRARAVDGQCYVIAVSPARSHPPSPSDKEGKSSYPHYTAWGHSTVVSPWGEIVSTIDEKPGIVLADLEMNKVDEMRQGIPTGNQKRWDLYTFEDKKA